MKRVVEQTRRGGDGELKWRRRRDKAEEDATQPRFIRTAAGGEEELTMASGWRVGGENMSWTHHPSHPPSAVAGVREET